MVEKMSILGNKILYDEQSISQDLGDILEEKYGDLLMGKSIQDLHDPYLLNDMEKAVERIKQAKERREKVIIFGDYDVDGVTSTVLLMHFFTTIGLQASYRIPDRVKDGYGMKTYFIDELAKLGVTLLVSVDCGTKDIEVVDYAKKYGIDVIITDHHAVPEIIPQNAVALINPKRPDSTYPFSGLAGAGVAFKLIQALVYKFFPDEEALKYLERSIDIAAIGTVADCMSLTDENRIIVSLGLKQVSQSRSKGIQKLLQDKNLGNLDGDVFGFHIGPRLNAAGRLDSAYKAVNLLLNNGEKVDENLREIEVINEKRKKLTQLFFKDALDTIDTKNNLIFYVSAKIPHGIIGIVAGRITGDLCKPSIVLKDEGDKLVASCRSPEYFSMVEYLEKYKHYFLHFGGHKQAAGFSIAKDKFPEFRQEILKEVNLLNFSQFQKEIHITKVIDPLEISFGFSNEISRYKPYGIGNEKPLFLLQNLEYSQIEYLGQTKEHIAIKNKYNIQILGFGFGSYKKMLEERPYIDIVIDIFEDYWMGKRYIKARIVDFLL